MDGKLRWMTLIALLMWQMLQGVVSNTPHTTVIQHTGNSSSASGNTVATTITSSVAPLIVVAVAKNGDTDAVTSVTDNQSNTYLQATSARGQFGAATTDIWYCPNATAGVTTVTAHWGITSAFNRGNEVWEVGGLTAPILDIAAHNNTAGSGNVVTGATVTTTSTSGFVAAIVILGSGTVTQNPDSGNEFTSGGDTINGAINGAVSLISSAAGAHNPAWHTSGATPNQVDSVAAFK